MLLAAIVVTYNPDLLRLKKLIEKLKFQSDFIIIVDNNSKNKKDVGSVESIGGNIKKIFLDSNLGIAIAQNLGIQEAKNYKCSHIILFDQDSNISNSFVSDLYEDYLELSKIKKVGIIGPVLYNDIYNYYYPIRNVQPSGYIEKIKIEDISGNFIKSNMIIASGSLMSLNLIKDIGGMKDYFFIDSVDTEFSLRACANGYENFLSKRVIMNHTIGDKDILFFGKSIKVHTPFRRYYMLRNYLFMFNLKHIPKFYVLHMICRFLISEFIIILYSKNKVDYLKSFFKALYDGLIKKGFKN